MGALLGLVAIFLFVVAPIAALVHAVVPAISTTALAGAGLVLGLLLVLSQPPRNKLPSAHTLRPVEIERRLQASAITAHAAPLLAPKRVPIQETLRWRIFQRDGMRCKVCGATSRLTVDHIHPVVLGGTNDESNLQTLCRSCNSRKGARVT